MSIMPKDKNGIHLTIEEETKIVALLARGDTQESIEKEIGISQQTVSAVKKRNKENLAIISQKMLAKATEDALSIKQDANAKISHRLKRDDKAAQILDKAYDQYLNEEIDLKQFTEAARRIKELSINELVSVSKAMHDQSTAEEKPPATQSDLAALAMAIRSGDEVKITQAVFNAQSDPSPPQA